MRPAHEIIRRAVVTEKSVGERARSRYAFEVAGDANKPAIRQAVKEFFKVDVVSVRTIRIPGRGRRFGKHQGKTSPWKKAIVTLKPGQKIEMLESEG